MGRKCLVVLAIAAAVIATASGAHAAALRIAIVTDRPDDALPALIHAELEVLGFDVVIVASKEPFAKEAGALAFSARLVPTHAGVEVWLIDPAGSELTMHELVRTDGTSPSSIRTAAVRAVELLRARLTAPHPDGNEVPERAGPKPEVTLFALVGTDLPDVPKGRRGTYDLFLGPSAIASPGALSLGWGAFLQARGMPADQWGVGIIAMFPVSSAHVEANEGRATVSATLLGASLDWLPLPPSQRWQPHLGVALAGALIGMTGSAEMPLLDRSEQMFVVVPALRAGAALKISKRLALRSDGLVGASAPRVAIRFADREVAYWGRPLLSLSLGLEASL